MEFQNFERDIQRKFEYFQPTTDDSKIWMAIEDELPKEKKERRFYFWMFGVLSLVAVGTLSFIYFPNEADNVVTTDLVSKELKSAISEVKNEKTPIVVDRTWKTADEKIASNANQQSVNGGKKTETTIVEDQVGLSELQVFESSNVTNTSSSLMERTQLTVNRLPLISNDEFNFELTFDKKPVFSQVLSLLSKVNNEKNKSSVHLVLGVFIQKMKPSTDQVDFDLLELRDEAESALEMIQLSSLYEYTLSPRISLMTGLKFWSAQHQSQHTICKNDKIDRQFNTMNRVTKTTHLRYGVNQNLSIPIGLNFHIADSQKVRFNLTLSYEYSVWANHRGHEIDLDGSEYNISKDEEGRYARGGNNLSFSPVILYKLKEHLSLHFGGEYKLGLNDFTTSASLLNRSYDFYGVNIGLHYYFK